MTGQWSKIAKAEYLVLTSGFKGKRTPTLIFLYIIAAIWATVAAPIVIQALIELVMPMQLISSLLILLTPGLMRTVVMFLWTILLLMPLSHALQEFKIGHWEILLSHKLRTRDILIGTFLGKIPIYGLIIIFLAPILFTPFILAFQVNLIGKILFYSTVITTVLFVIWSANYVGSAIQAKLGSSPRGHDIAKALAWVITIISLVPMFGLMLFAPTMSEILGMNIFLILPFTWTADTITWILTVFSGVQITNTHLAVYTSIMPFNLWISGLLMLCFGLAVTGFTLLTTDRVFTLTAGMQFERVSKAAKEGFLLRGVRRIYGGSFGVLAAVSLKDFFRKAQNLAKIAYGVILATVSPLLLSFYETGGTDFYLILTMVSLSIPLAGVFPFTGVSFIESKDQLWVIQGSPKGPSKFIKARLASALIIALPISLIPSALLTILYNLLLAETLLILGVSYIGVVAAAMVGIGITAQNPNYENTKSPAHMTAIMTAAMICQITAMSTLFLDMILDMATGFSYRLFLYHTIGVPTTRIILAFTGSLILIPLGAIMLALGIRHLSQPET
jgi:hypothetical protein